MDNEAIGASAKWPTHASDASLERRRQLGNFLRRRRATIAPEVFGLPLLRRRRVAGLRREEIALLAGISVTWYSQLESGAEITVSLALLARLADILALTPLERAYVFALGVEELAVMRTALPELDFASGARIAAGRFEDEIAHALRAHRSIKTQIYGATLQSTQARVRADFDETRCPIGYWLQDDLAPAARASAGYSHASRAHCAFHREIDRVLGDAAAENHEGESALAAPGAYALASSRLEDALRDWPAMLAS